MHSFKPVVKSTLIQRGFTLVELVIVLALIAIILAFVTPQFVGLRAKAVDRGAQVAVRAAVTAARTAAVDYNDDYLAPGFTFSAVADEERSVHILDTGTAATNNKEVSVAKDASDNAIYVTSKGNRRCWIQRQQLSLGTAGASDLSGDRYAVTSVSDTGSCLAPTAPGSLDWKTEWPPRK